MQRTFDFFLLEVPFTDGASRSGKPSQSKDKKLARDRSLRAKPKEFLLLSEI